MDPVWWWILKVDRSLCTVHKQQLLQSQKQVLGRMKSNLHMWAATCTHESNWLKHDRRSMATCADVARREVESSGSRRPGTHRGLDKGKVRGQGETSRDAKEWQSSLHLLQHSWSGIRPDRDYCATVPGSQYLLPQELWQTERLCVTATKYVGILWGRAIICFAVGTRRHWVCHGKCCSWCQMPDAFGQQSCSDLVQE